MAHVIHKGKYVYEHYRDGNKVKSKYKGKLFKKENLWIRVDIPEKNTGKPFVTTEESLKMLDKFLQSKCRKPLTSKEKRQYMMQS